MTTRSGIVLAVALAVCATLSCVVSAQMDVDALASDGDMVKTLQALVEAQESQILSLSQQVKSVSRETRQKYLSEHERLKKQELEHRARVEHMTLSLLELSSSSSEGDEGEDEGEDVLLEENGKDVSDDNVKGDMLRKAGPDTNSASKKPGDEAMRNGPPRRRGEIMKLSKYVDQVKDSSYETFRELRYQLWVFKHRYKRKTRALNSYRKKLRAQQKALEEYEIKVKIHLKGMRGRMRAFLETVTRITQHNKELNQDLTDDKSLAAKFREQLENQLRRIEELQQQMEKMMALDTRLRSEQRDFTNDLATLKSTLEEIDPVQKRLWAQEEAYQKAGVKDGQHLRQLQMGIQLLKRKHLSWQTNLLRKVTGKLQSSQDMIDTSIKRAGMLVDQARGDAAGQLKKLVGSQLGDRVQGVEAELFEKEVANELKKQVSPQLTQYLSRQKLLMDELNQMKEAAKTGKWEPPESMFHEAETETAAAPAAEGAPGAATGDVKPAEGGASKEGGATTPAPAADELLQLQATTEGGFIPVKCRCVQELGEVPESGAPMHCFCDHH